MNTYSLGLVLVRLIAEGEAKARNFERILPEHLWIGLCKISDLPEEVVTGILDLSTEEKSALLGEVRALQHWFVARQIDTTRLRRRLRSLLGKGKGTKTRLHRSPESLALFKNAAQLTTANKEDVVHRIRKEQQQLLPERLVLSSANFASSFSKMLFNSSRLFCSSSFSFRMDYFLHNNHIPLSKSTVHIMVSEPCRLFCHA